jgi:hypothetical protein
MQCREARRGEARRAGMLSRLATLIPQQIARPIRSTSKVHNVRKVQYLHTITLECVRTPGSSTRGSTVFAKCSQSTVFAIPAMFAMCALHDQCALCTAPTHPTLPAPAKSKHSTTQKSRSHSTAGAATSAGRRRQLIGSALPIYLHVCMSLSINLLPYLGILQNIQTKKLP